MKENMKILQDIDTVRFGDILKQFGGMKKLNIFDMIDFMHKKYVNKKVMFCIKLNGIDQIRIRVVKNFSIEAHKWLVNKNLQNAYSFKFEFENNNRILLVSDDDTRISILDDNKN